MILNQEQNLTRLLNNNRFNKSLGAKIQELDANETNAKLTVTL